MIFPEIRLAHESCPGFETKFNILDFPDRKSLKIFLANTGKLIQKFAGFSVSGHELDRFLKDSSRSQNSQLMIG